MLDYGTHSLFVRCVFLMRDDVSVGSIPVMTPPYGSVPVGENRRAGQSGGYGNVPSAPPNDPKYGSLPSGINGANGYGSIPEMK